MTAPLRDEAVSGTKNGVSSFKNPVWLLLLLIFPALLIFVAFSIRTASGPYWLSENLDPSYPYLLNGLNLSNLRRPYHVDHPGTPIQTIAAATIRASNFGTDENSRAREVLNSPESYLHRINNVFILLAATSLLIGGYVVFRSGRDILSAVVFQSAPFLSWATMQGLLGVRPEPLLLSISILFAALILLTLRFDTRRYALQYSLAFGVLAGLGMASKINFLPLLLIPFILLRQWKWRAFYAVTTGLSFLFFIAPILTPHHLRLLLGFAVNVSTHTGRYGTGAAGIVEARQFLRNAGNLIAADWPFFLILMASVWLLALRRKRAAAEDGRYRILPAVTLAQFLQLLIVAKHPSNHYLIPALGLAGVNLVLLFGFIRGAAFRGWSPYPILAVICAVILVVQILVFTKRYERLIVLSAKQRGAHAKVMREFKSLPVVNYYSASSADYALKFGAEYSGNLYPSILAELYPGSLFYNPWTQEFSGFNGRFEGAQLKASRDGFVMRGYSLKDSDFGKFLPPNAFPEDLVLEPVYGGDVDGPGVYDGEAVYRVRFKSAP